jgi:hypothetical protein
MPLELKSLLVDLRLMYLHHHSHLITASCTPHNLTQKYHRIRLTTERPPRTRIQAIAQTCPIWRTDLSLSFVVATVDEVDASKLLPVNERLNILAAGARHKGVPARDRPGVSDVSAHGR